MLCGSGNSRRVLLTGSSGAIGRQALATLAARGFDVTIMSRQALAELPAGATAQITADLRDFGTVRKAVGEVDAVCHCAAFIPANMETVSAAEDCLKVNALATMEIAAAAAERGICMVHCSSAQIYCISDRPANEEACTYPADRATAYLASKLCGELYVENLRRRHSLRSVVLRIGSCYGPGLPARSVVSFFMNRARNGESLTVLDGGVPSYDLVYVNDAAAAVVDALEHAQPGIYNIGSGIGTTVLQLAEGVRSVFSDRDIAIEVKAPAGTAAPSFTTLDISKARSAWGFSPRSLCDGLRAFRDHLELP